VGCFLFCFENICSGYDPLYIVFVVFVVGLMASTLATFFRFMRNVNVPALLSLRFLFLNVLRVVT